MTLDLEELIGNWNCPRGEITARTIIGRAGEELIQLRVELGVMQMFPDGRPDGSRVAGGATVCALVQKLRREGRAVSAAQWQELERELLQTNYRRLALGSLVEQALEADQPDAARTMLRRCLRDIDTCLAALEMLRERSAPAGWVTLRPTLVFNRARLLVQLHTLDGEFEEAVEQAEAGAAQLTALLSESGVDAEQGPEDPGVQILQEMSRKIRREQGIELTLSERLNLALESDDFELAARLRDEIRKRRSNGRGGPGGKAAPGGAGEQG